MSAHFYLCFVQPDVNLNREFSGDVLPKSNCDSLCLSCKMQFNKKEPQWPPRNAESKSEGEGERLGKNVIDMVLRRDSGLILGRTTNRHENMCCACSLA